jgi:hypothetical protein
MWESGKRDVYSEQFTLLEGEAYDSTQLEWTLDNGRALVHARQHLVWSRSQPAIQQLDRYLMNCRYILRSYPLQQMQRTDLAGNLHLLLQLLSEETGLRVLGGRCPPPATKTRPSCCARSVSPLATDRPLDSHLRASGLIQAHACLPLSRCGPGPTAVMSKYKRFR